MSFRATSRLRALPVVVVGRDQDVGAQPDPVAAGLLDQQFSAPRRSSVFGLTTMVRLAPGPGQNVSVVAKNL
jgi:hypothetical protein